MIQKELLKLPVEDLVPYENNPRVISPEAVNACAESMRQCTALDPIEVDENNVILSGHTRRLALMQLHVDMADVVRYTGLTEEQKQKYRILANKTGEMTGWDFSKLEQELAEVDFGDFDFNFDSEAPEDIFDDSTDLRSEYDEPHDDRLICPCCGHIDLKAKFKNLKESLAMRKTAMSENIPQCAGKQQRSSG